MGVYTTDVNRVTGLSGIDTDSMIEKLMTAESAKYDSLQQKQTWVGWQQDAYREVITSLQNFQNKWFGTNLNNNFKYSSTFKSFNTQIKDSNGNISSAIKINSVNTNLNSKIEVKQLANKNSITSETFKKGLTTTKTENEITDTIKNKGNISLKFELDGNLKTINIEKSELEKTDLTTVLNDKLKKVFGSEANGDAKVSITKNKDEKLNIKTTTGHTLKFFAGSEDSSEVFGLTPGSSTSILETTPISEVFGEDFNTYFEANKNKDDVLELNFGSSKIILEKNETLSSFMNKVNNSDANFNLSFNTLSQSFKVESKESGASNSIDINDTKSKEFFKNFLKIDVDNTSSPNYVKGQDAIVVVDGVETSRTSNNIKLDNINFTINNITNGALDVTSDANIDDVYKKITGFVEDYNKLIEDLNAKISESRAKSGEYSYYEPLTESQRKAMSEDEIKKWEEKAKTGLLYKDAYIDNLLSNLRSTIYQSVETTSGKKISLYQMGITTSSDWKNNGKLIIDENKLKESIKNNSEDIQTLFTKTNHGIGDKIDAAINSAINSKNGTLRLKAGIKNTSSEKENLLSKELKDISARMTAEKERLYKKETQYYKMFTSMETIMNKQNSQLNMLYSLMGS